MSEGVSDPRQDDDWHLGAIVEDPPPAVTPVYARAPGKVSHARTWTLEEAIDGAFFLAGAVLVLGLGILLAVGGLTPSVYAIGYLILFWVLVAYIGLPRLQEVLAKVFVPDYFIGRAVTGSGVLGDPINLAVDGSAGDVHAAMTAAGWVRADEVTLRSSWGIIVSSVLRRPYTAAPVSPLFVFGHRQAFAYEQEVDGSASQRHHVRFWPVPAGWVLPGGFRVGWLAAATYDRAVGLSAFTLQVTHKVDADIDVERDYVIATVRFTSPTVVLRLIRDASAAFHSRNGGGDLVRSDGNLPVLELTGLGGPVAAAPTPPTIATRRLPPPALLLAGVVSTAKAGVTLVGLLLVLLGTYAAGHASTGQLVRSGVGAGLTLVLWAATLAHRRWARTLLMAVCTVEAITQLATLDAAGHLNLLVVVTASMSVLILIAVSSTEARRWISASRGGAPTPAPSPAAGPRR